MSPTEQVWSMSESWDSFWCERVIATMQLRLDAAKEREAAKRAADDRRIEKLVAECRADELDALNKKSARLEERSGRMSGLEGFQSCHDEWCQVLKQIESLRLRPLTRWEFINLYGYGQWRSFVDANGLQEDSPEAVPAAA